MGDEKQFNVEELQSLARRLQVVLEEPQPGLIGWTDSVKWLCDQIGGFGYEKGVIDGESSKT